jgi:hypothetical protein
MTYGYYAEKFIIKIEGWKQDRRALSKAQDSVFLWHPKVLIRLCLNTVHYKENHSLRVESKPSAFANITYLNEMNSSI